MSKATQSWARAQKRERRFYENSARVFSNDSQPYAHFHGEMWTAILAELREIEFLEQGLYVDVGCGPNPIVALIDHGTKIGIDPLMSFYESTFTLPSDVRMEVGTIEEMSQIDDSQADLVFTMNNIDHVRDLRAAVHTMRRKLKPTGTLVVGVNIVGNPLTAALSRLVDIYRLLDPTHTYHFHSPDEFIQALTPEFQLVRYKNIEYISKKMQDTMASRTGKASSIADRVRKALKFLKNDVLLHESYYLFIFSPQSALGIANDLSP